MNELLRRIPKVDEVLKQEGWRKVAGRFPGEVAKDALRDVLDGIRAAIKEGSVSSVPALDAIIARAETRMGEIVNPRLKRVINGTGVIIHTNLGRSALAQAAIDAIVNAASNYSNLEYDIEKGTRGDRYEHCTDILRRLTGAEAGLIVNNNAAAVLLVLNTLANGKEVVISRGELIEIGGSFRIPDVMERSGAILTEVGTTNRTFIEDYERALSEKTGLIMKAHTSNYRIRGFTHEASGAELVSLGKRHGLPVYFDTGSGLLFPLEGTEALDEPCVATQMKTGYDVVSFSGDKLLGGPQAGIIVGQASLVAAMKKNPLTRALRPDKFTLSALESTLLLYLDREKAKREIPTLRMLYQDEKDLKRRAGRIAARLRQRCPGLVVTVTRLYSEVGGGTLPDVSIPSYGLALEPAGMTPATFEERLRLFKTPIIGRIEKERLLLDMRTIREPDEAPLISGIETALADGA